VSQTAQLTRNCLIIIYMAMTGCTIRYDHQLMCLHAGPIGSDVRQDEGALPGPRCVQINIDDSSSA
jgi:hypothetical protein